MVLYSRSYSKMAAVRVVIHEADRFNHQQFYLDVFAMMSRVVSRTPPSKIIEYIENNFPYNYYDQFEGIIADCFLYNYPEVLKYLYERGGFIFTHNNAPIYEYFIDNIDQGNTNIELLDWLIDNHVLNKMLSPTPTESVYSEREDIHMTLSTLISHIVNIVFRSNSPKTEVIDWIIRRFPMFISDANFNRIIKIGYKKDLDTLIRYIRTYDAIRPFEYLFNIQEFTAEIYNASLLEAREDVIEYMEQVFCHAPYNNDIDNIRSDYMSSLVYTGINERDNVKTTSLLQFRYKPRETFHFPYLIFMTMPDIMENSVRKLLGMNIILEFNPEFWEKILIQSIFVGNIDVTQRVFDMIPSTVQINKTRLADKINRIVDLTNTDEVFGVRRQRIFIWLKNKKNINITVRRQRNDQNLPNSFTDYLLDRVYKSGDHNDEEDDVYMEYDDPDGPGENIADADYDSDYESDNDIDD